MCPTRPRALIVDDDAETIETARDVVASLNHDCDTTMDQENARQLLVPERFAYVLLNLAIPVKPGRPCREANARNLIAEIRAAAGMEAVPVIVMSDLGNDGLEMAVSLLTNSAADFPALSVPGTGFSVSAVGPWANDRVVIVALDHDDAGDGVVHPAADAAYDHGANLVVRVPWSPGCKDACDQLARFGPDSLVELLDHAPTEVSLVGP